MLVKHGIALAATVALCISTALDSGISRARGIIAESLASVSLKDCLHPAYVALLKAFTEDRLESRGFFEFLELPSETINGEFFVLTGNLSWTKFFLNTRSKVTPRRH